MKFFLPIIVSCLSDFAQVTAGGVHKGGKKDCQHTSGVISREEYLKGTRLFKRADDLGESRDLVHQKPEVTQRLERLYCNWPDEIAQN